jgi:hypothetical protein
MEIPTVTLYKHGREVRFNLTDLPAKLADGWSEKPETKPETKPEISEPETPEKRRGRPPKAS